MSQSDSESQQPSLDVVASEVESLLGEQDRRGNNFDTKAGLLLGFCGVLIGLSPSDQNFFHILGKVFAAIAAGAAMYAMFPRISGAVKPRALRDRYLARPAAETKLRLLDTKIWLHERDEFRLASKVERMRVAVWCLAFAVLLLLTATVVSVATEGSSHEHYGRDPR